MCFATTQHTQSVAESVQYLVDKGSPSVHSTRKQHSRLISFLCIPHRNWSEERETKTKQLCSFRRRPGVEKKFFILSRCCYTILISNVFWFLFFSRFCSLLCAIFPLVSVRQNISTWRRRMCHRRRQWEMTESFHTRGLPLAAQEKREANPLLFHCRRWKSFNFN